MIWVIVIVGIIVVVSISSAANKSKEAARTAEATAITSEKSLAYKDYLKRTSKDSKITGMTDNELNEFVASNIRSYNKETSDIEGGSQVMFGIVGMGFLMWAAAIEAFLPIIFGIIALFFAFKYKKSSMAKVDVKYKQRGLDPKRLKVETSS